MPATNVTNTPNLHTVQGLVKGVRAKLQDRIQPYRYSDTAIIAGINISLLEGYMLRPDLFICRQKFEVPQYGEPSGDELPFEPQFRVAFEYGAAAYVLLNDVEDVLDDRANSFDDKFSILLTGRPRVAKMQGATPAPAKGS